ncbi:MAG: GEVED domain-containing protein [Candidatus Zixiibacteriota bacterium]
MNQCFSNPRKAKLISLVMIIIVFCAAQVAAQLDYCEAGGGCGAFISSVQINGMTNSSACDGYSYYSDSSVMVWTFDTLHITVELANADMNDQVGVWVGWDSHYLFDGVEDEIGTAVGSGPHTFIYEVPLLYREVTTRLRVRLCRDQTPEPCGVTEFGEVEDYTIIQETDVVCGDSNNDGNLNIGDAVYLVNFIFKGGPEPPVMCLADANGDANVNMGDPVYLIGYIFKGGPRPSLTCCWLVAP